VLRPFSGEDELEHCASTSFVVKKQSPTAAWSRPERPEICASSSRLSRFSAGLAIRRHFCISVIEHFEGDSIRGHGEGRDVLSWWRSL